MKTKRRRRRERGQAIVELGLSLPFLLLLAIGCADLGRAFFVSLTVSGMSYEGARNGSTSAVADIGNQVRSASTLTPNTSVAWGDTASGGVNANCTSASGQHCGDPNGCPASVFTNGRVACFAVRTCVLSALHDGTLTGCAWNVRPAAGSGQVAQIRVVYAYRPSAPFVAPLIGGNAGIVYVSTEVAALELY